MDLSTLSEKKNRPIRLAFTQFIIDRYGINFQTAHGKLRKLRLRKWELVGIENCIRIFSPDYDGELKDFIERTESKTAFYNFMANYGMSGKTAFVRFQQFRFSELEIKGLNAAYDEFVSYIKD